jgi:hypothetical protein
LLNGKQRRCPRVVVRMLFDPLFAYTFSIQRLDIFGLEC